MRVGNAAGVLVASVLVARELPSGAAGRYLYLFALLALASTVSRLGTGALVLRSITADPALRWRPENVSHFFVATAGTLVSSLALAVLYIATSTSHGADVGLVLVLMWLPAESYRYLFAESVRATGRHVPASLLADAGRSISLAALSVVVRPTTLNGWLGLSMGVSWAWLVVAVVFARRIHGRLLFVGGMRVRVRQVWVEARTGAAIVLSDVAALGVNQGDLWIAGLALASTDLAAYALALRLSSAFALPVVALTQSVAPAIGAAVAAGDTAAVEHRARDLTGGLTLLSASGLVAWIFVGDSLSEQLFGQGYASVGTISAILMFGQLANVFYGPAVVWLIMAGLGSRLLRVTVASGSLTLACELVILWVPSPLLLALVSAAGTIVQNSWLRSAVRSLLHVEAAASLPSWVGRYLRRNT